ncbi:hypothetical protein ACIBQ1_19675 [Nonomuraea sp. NPDC050153]|uniref:hypothetical protein n=1 Tax=Nonomuraea sp. NPDC050153 TaxID=3364359 RepID=UPI0037964B3E
MRKPWPAKVMVNPPVVNGDEPGHHGRRPVPAPGSRRCHRPSPLPITDGRRTMSSIVSEILFCTAIAAASAVMSPYRRTPPLRQACSPQGWQSLVLLIRDEIDEKEHRRRQAMTGRAPGRSAHTCGKPTP